MSSQLDVAPDSLIVIFFRGPSEDGRSDERKSIDAILCELCGVGWNVDARIQLIAYPKFEGKSGVDILRLRQNWKVRFQQWYFGGDRYSDVIFYPGTPVDPKILTRPGDAEKVSWRTYPKTKRQFSESLESLIKKRDLSLQRNVEKLLGQWDFRSQIETAGTTLMKWQSQFKSNQEKAASRLILQSFRMLKVNDLLLGLPLDALKLSHSNASFFLLGGTSDGQIRGPANRQAQIDLMNLPEDGNLWKNSDAAIILTDWCEVAPKIRPGSG